MYKSKLYAKYNSFSKKIVNHVVQKYFNKLEWNVGDNLKLLDVGCGEGTNLKNIVIPALPIKHVAVTGIDQSEEMIKDANMLFKEQKSFNFFPVSIEDQYLDQKLKSKFDHIVSFNCLHFVPDQNVSFNNLHKLLKPNGKMFILRSVYQQLFEVYDQLAEQLSHPPYLNRELFCRFYQDIKKEPEAIIDRTTNFLTKRGFINAKVWVEPLRSNPLQVEDFLLWTLALNPFWKYVPNEDRKTYFRKHCANILNMEGVIMDYNEDDTISLTWEIDFVVISATKL